jgi:citrate synthase
MQVDFGRTADDYGKHRAGFPEAFFARAVVETMGKAGHPPPTVDFGLVALASALGLPPGAAAAVFAVGRSAGWVAHVLEQREQGHLLRPRARYVAAPPPGTDDRSPVVTAPHAPRGG